MSDVQMTFESVSEALPGPKWQRLFARYKPAYLAWFSARSRADAPERATCEAALARHMPELMATYRRLVALAGGDDATARLLTCYRPPAYLVSCSQAAVAGPDGAVLIRNYDLEPALNEGLILDTAWTGRRVIGSSEFLWGLADGMNQDGLAVSLAFGGSKETGDGFGIPLIIRYLLETCNSVEAALATLVRVPSHMAYNVTLADRGGATASVQLKPGGGMTVSDRAAATNHQGAAPVWPEHAGFTRSLERERVLHDALAGPAAGTCGLVSRFLSAPSTRPTTPTASARSTRGLPPGRGRGRMALAGRDDAPEFRRVHRGQPDDRAGWQHGAGGGAAGGRRARNGARGGVAGGAGTGRDRARPGAGRLVPRGGGQRYSGLGGARGGVRGWGR